MRLGTVMRMVCLIGAVLAGNERCNSVSWILFRLVCFWLASDLDSNAGCALCLRISRVLAGDLHVFA
jgi:hypothetical protein